VVVKGTTQETLCYDNTGKFLKKMGAKGWQRQAGTKNSAQTSNKELISVRRLDRIMKAVHF